MLTVGLFVLKQLTIIAENNMTKAIDGVTMSSMLNMKDIFEVIINIFDEL